jgi:hypothetical protein
MRTRSKPVGLTRLQIYAVEVDTHRGQKQQGGQGAISPLGSRSLVKKRLALHSR